MKDKFTLLTNWWNLSFIDHRVEEYMFSFSVFNYLSQVSQIRMLLIESSRANLHLQDRTEESFFLNDILSCGMSAREKVVCGQVWYRILSGDT